MRSKLEREIEEILAKTSPPSAPTPIRSRRPTRKPLFAGVRERVGEFVGGINPGQVMLGSALVVIGSWFVLRPFDDLMRIVAIAGLIAFLGAFVLAMINRRSGRTTSSSPSARYWRGQPIDYSTRSQSGQTRNPFRDFWRRR